MMRNKPYFRPYVPGDLPAVRRLAYRLREHDKREIRAATGKVDLTEILEDSITVSAQVYVMCRPDGELWGIFGIGESYHERGSGVPWMVSTDEIRKYRKEFVKGAKLVINLWRHMYDRMFNMVSAENSVSIMWLASLGFCVHGHRLPRNGLDFRMFSMECDYV